MMQNGCEPDQGACHESRPPQGGSGIQDGRPVDLFEDPTTDHPMYYPIKVLLAEHRRLGRDLAILYHPPKAKPETERELKKYLKAKAANLAEAILWLRGGDPRLKATDLAANAIGILATARLVIEHQDTSSKPRAKAMGHLNRKVIDALVAAKRLYDALVTDDENAKIEPSRNENGGEGR